MKYTKCEDFVYRNKKFSAYKDELGTKFIAKSVDASQYDLLSKINDVSNKCRSLLEIEAFFKLEDQLIYLTKILEHNTLQDVIDAKLNLSRDDVYVIFEQIADAILALHNVNIVHRDIKPANILISNKLEVKVIDFDISREYKEKQMVDTTLFGTRGYAAPEQYGFSQTNIKSDIYSLGKTIEALLNNCYDTFDLQFEKIVYKACQIDPKNRFSSINEIKEILAIYDFERQSQIKKGLELGLNKQQISLYSNADLDDKQMGVIKHAIYEGVDLEIIKFMVKSDLDSRQLWQVKQASIDGCDIKQIKHFAKQYYSPEEMGILRAIITQYDDFNLATKYLKFYHQNIVLGEFEEEQKRLIRKFIYHGISLSDLQVVAFNHLSLDKMNAIFNILKENDVTR